MEDKKIHVREYAASICDLFEELLDRFDIYIPDDDRELDDRESECRIYGMTYAELEDNVKDKLMQLLIERDQYDEPYYETYEY